MRCTCNWNWSDMVFRRSMHTGFRALGSSERIRRNMSLTERVKVVGSTTQLFDT